MSKSASENPVHWGVSGGAFRLYRGNREQWAISDPEEAFALSIVLADGDVVVIDGPDGEAEIEGAALRAKMIRDLMGMVIARAGH